jgi:glutathione transport system ATP-binding protein
MTVKDEPLLDVDRLRVGFRGRGGIRAVVSDLSFQVARGETLAIVGESGSGKSVTALSVLRLIEDGGGVIEAGRIGFARKSGERIDLLQQSEASLRRIRGAEISMIFQEPMTSLNPVMRVGDQIAEAVTQHEGKSRREARATALDMLELARIPSAKRVLDRYPHELSGGMRQRVMIGMALSCRPSLLIADEPTTALDATVQAQILHLIRSLQDEIGMSVMFITHDMGAVAEIADRVVVMNRGDLIETASVADIFAHPSHPYTRSLLQATPVLGAMRGLPPPAPEAAPPEDAAPEPPVPASPLLRLDHLTVRFDDTADLFGKVRTRVHAVEKVSFDLARGETLAVVGESGCGKSTLGRSILKLVPSVSGRIMFEGFDVTPLHGGAMSRIRRDIQYVFQDPFASLDPRRTVGDSIAEPLRVHRLEKGSAITDRVAELLRKVGLQPEHARRYPHEFSGGQRQRICIARALAPSPKLIIADESVAALDVSIRAQIVDLLIQIQQELGMAYIFISHDLPVVERISHRVAVMRLGQIVEIGTRQEIFETPLHPYTRRLLDAAPIPDPRRRRHRLPAQDGDLPSPVRQVGDEPVVEPLLALGGSHFVAAHAIGGLQI